MRDVLILEDDPQFVEIYRYKLQQLGCKVRSATTVKEAKAAITTQMPDIILLDIMLPGNENGFDLLREVRENLRAAHTPVIVLTNLPADHAKTADALGAKKFFVKAESSIDQVMSTITSFLKMPHSANGSN